MKIVSYNIQFATGRDGIVDTARIAAEVQGADIIALQEVDRYWQRSGDMDQVAAFTGAFPDYHHEYGAGVNIPADSWDGNGRLQHRRRQFGNMILSRYPILYCRHHLLPKYGSVGPISIQRSLLETVVAAPFGPLRIMNTHLTHLSAETRIPQVKEILRIHRDAALEGNPVCGDLAQSYWQGADDLPETTRTSIVLGDFNMEPDSTEYTLMTGPVCDYGGRIINPEGFADAHVLAGNDADGVVTSDIHGRPVRLDYIFISPILAPSVFNSHVDNDACGSDHQPIWLELRDETCTRQ